MKTPDDDERKDGDAAKREGMDRARRSANPEWWRVTLICVQEIARRTNAAQNSVIEPMCLSTSSRRLGIDGSMLSKAAALSGLPR